MASGGHRSGMKTSIDFGVISLSVLDLGPILPSRDTLEFDIWPLADTWNIKHFGAEPTLASLAMLGPFNADCIVLDNNLNQIDFGFRSCLSSKMLEINFEPNPHPQHNVLRGLRIIDNLGISPGASFCNYVLKHRSGLDKEIERYKKHYGLDVNTTMLEAILR